MTINVMLLPIFILAICPGCMSGMKQTLHNDETAGLDKTVTFPLSRVQFTEDYHHTDVDTVEANDSSSSHATHESKDGGMNVTAGRSEQNVITTRRAQLFSQAEKENNSLTCYPCDVINKLGTSIIAKVKKELGGLEDSTREKSLCQYFYKYYREKGLLKSSQNSQQVVQVKNQKNSLLLVSAVPHRSTLKVESNFNIPVRKILYNCKSMMLEVETMPTGKFSIITGLADVEEAAIFMKVSFKTKPWKLVYLGFEANLILHQLVVSVTITYKPGEGELLIESKAHGTKTFDVKEFIKKLTDVTLPFSLPSFTLRDATLTAKVHISKASNAIIIISGIINDRKVALLLQMHLKSSRKFEVAFAIDLPSFKLADLVEKMTSVDISRFPFFGSLSLPRLQLTYSSSNPPTKWPTTKFPLNLTWFKGALQSIKNGLLALVDIKLDGKNVPMRLHFMKKIIKFSVLKTGALRLHSLLVALSISMTNLAIPPGVKILLQAQIHQFSLDLDTAQLDFYFKIPGTLTYFDGKLIVRNPMVNLTAILKKPPKVWISIDGEMELKKKRLEVSIKRSEKDNGYVFSASIGEISLQSIARLFSSSKDPPKLGFLDKTPFNDFRIINASITFPMTLKPLRLQLSGVPVIHGIKTAHVNIVVLKDSEQKEVVQGFQILSASLLHLLSKLTSVPFNQIGFLQQQANVAIIISSVTVQDIKLHGSMLKDMPIKKGVSVRAAITWPNNCDGNKFCAVMQHLIKKGSNLHLTAVINSKHSFRATIALPDIRFKIGLTLAQANLVIDRGSSLKVLITANLIIPGTNAQSTAAALAKGSEKFVIKVTLMYSPKENLMLVSSSTQNSLSVNMNNMIEKLAGVPPPLPLPSLSIEDVSLVATISMSSNGGATLVISGVISGNKYYFVLQKRSGQKGEKYALAFGSELKEFKLSALLKKLFEVDISGIPFFGSLSFPQVKLMYSNKKLISKLFATSLPQVMLQRNAASVIAEGLQGEVKLRFGSHISLLHLSFIKNKPMTLSAWKKGTLKLSALLSAIGIDVSSMSLPPGLKKSLNIGIQQFLLDPLTGKLELNVHLPFQPAYFGGRLKLSSVIIHIQAVLKKPRSFTLEAQGEITLDTNKKVKIDIKKPNKSGEYILKATADEVSLLSIVRTFSKSGLPSSMKFLEKTPLFQIKILQLRLLFPFTRQPAQIHISGTPEIYGVKTAHISILVLKKANNVFVIQGYQLEQVMLVDILQKLTKKSLSNLSFLQQKINVGVVISPVTIPGVKLYGKMLEKIPITRGAVVEAKIRWPEQCSSKLCTLLQRILGKGASINLKAKIVSKDLFNITVYLPDVKLMSWLTLTQVCLAIHVRSEGTVYGLQGDLVFSSSGEKVTMLNIHHLAHKMDKFALHVSVVYKKKDNLLLIKSQSTTSLNVIRFIKQLTKLTLPLPLPSLTIERISLVATIDLSKSGKTTVVFSGSVNRNKFYFVLQSGSSTGKKSAVAFGALLRSFKLSQLLKNVLNLDISSIPFFNTLTIPDLQMMFSFENISSPLLSMALPREFLVRGTLDKIGKGFQALMNLRFSQNTIPVQLHMLRNKILEIASLKEGALTFQSLFSAFNIDVKSWKLPKGIKDLFHVGVQNFQLDPTTGKLSLDIALPRKLTYFDGKLVIHNPRIKIHAQVKKPPKFSIEVGGKFKVKKHNYQVSIRKATTGSKKGYIVKLAMDELSLWTLTNLLSGSGVPGALRFLEKTPLFRLKVLHAKIAFPVSAKPLQLHISGTPVLFGLKTVHMNVVLVKIGHKIQVIRGFQLRAVKIADVLKKITGKNIGKIGIVQQELDASIIVSPVNLQGVRLHGKLLDKTPIRKGFTLKSQLKWPPNCVHDKFCALSQRLVGKKAQMFLLVTTNNFDDFTLRAQLANIRLGKGTILSHAGLVIHLGSSTEFGIEGELLLEKPAIRLYAAIKVGVRGTVLQGNMKGCWNNAFGASWLSICNLHLLIGFQPTVTGIGALEFGGEIRLGKCPPRIIAKGYIGADQMSPKNNFVYAEMKGPFTMQSVLYTFHCKKINLPKPIADSGFPEGFLVSFSPVGKRIPEVGLEIPPGYRIKGTFNILGLVGKVDMSIIISRGYRLHVEIGPINIAGLLKMYASETDHKRGPYLKVLLERTHHKTHFEIDARGFLYVLGMSVEASLKVTTKTYEFFIRGKFLNLFEANLHITSSYGSLKKASFRVKGYLRNDLFVKLREKLTRILRQSADNADKKISAAQNKIRRVQGRFDAADRKLRAAQAKVKKAERAFDSAIGTLRNRRRRVDNICHERRCRSGWWGIGCRVRNFGCRVLKAGIKGLIRIAEAVVRTSKGALHIANAALYVARGVVAAAKHTLNIAIAALEVVKRLYKIGIEAALLIVKFTLGGILDIRELYFNVALGGAVKGEFEGRIKISFFGKPPVQLGFYINLRDIGKMVKQLFTQIFSRRRRQLK